jgi:NADPH-dependent curcumin reductase CurA
LSTAEPSRQIVLAALPEGRLSTDCFRLEEAPRPSPREGEVLLKALYITLDASNRAYMQGATYAAALKAGDVMYGRALAEVAESRADGFAPGELVFAEMGWRDWGVMPARLLQKRPRAEPLSHQLSVYGISGLTAYFGLLEVGRLRAGDTVVISAAGGAVGTIAGQIARIGGARVIGIAGGPEKCARLTRELGYHACLDHRAGNLREQLREACPNGVDLYFDNVGGQILETCLPQMVIGGRIACCGSVSTYDGAPPAAGPRGLPGLLVTRRLTMAGFLVSDFNAKRDRALADLRGWVESGALTVPEHITEGLETLPAALVGLLAGENFGKRMVKVG